MKRFERNTKRIKIYEDRFREVLLKHGLTIQKFAKIPGIPSSITIYRQLRDPDGMTYELISKINRVLTSSFHEPSILKTCSDCGIMKRIEFTRWEIMESKE